MAGGGQMGGGQPPSGAYGSPNFDSSNPVNQPPSGSGMKPPMGGLGTMGMAGMGMAGAMPQEAYGRHMGDATPQQPSAYDTAYQPRYNYMYGNPMANPFGGGMNPFYGGYSPFYPQLPQSASLFGQNRLSDVQGEMDAEAEAEEEKQKRRRPIGYGMYEYY